MEIVMVQKNAVAKKAVGLWLMLKDKFELRDRLLPMNGRAREVPAVVRVPLGNGLVRINYK